MYKFREITQEEALVIADEWHYENPYSFYDIQADQEDYEEFINPDTRENTYVAFNEENELIGYIAFSVNDSIEIGLGLNPNYTGKGFGKIFLMEAISFISSYYPSLNKYSLKVAAFNKRAIEVYKRCGFKEVDTLMMATNGSVYEFIEMVYDKSLERNWPKSYKNGTIASKEELYFTLRQ